jgi:polyisoprenoid-binding protein YceI
VTRSVLRLAIVTAAIVILGAGAYGGWYLFLRPSGPSAVSVSTLPLPSASPGGSAAMTPFGSGAVPGASAQAGLDGTWQVDTTIGAFTDFTSSFVGYRVQEQLAGFGANMAVGRTPDVTGSMTLHGATVTAATITANVTTLRSDDSRRDGRLRDQGLETGRFPTASFALTKPIDLGSLPADGATVSVTATGDLTLHGQTRNVQIALQAKRSGEVIAVTGSLEIAFADYGISPPTSFLVLSIQDHGTLELQLLFTHA